MIDIKAKELLSQILNMMDIEYDKVEVEKDANTMRVNILSPHSGLLIGYRGERVNAFQHILKSLLWEALKEEGNGESFLLIVDVDNYKKRQEQNLYELAERKALKLRESKEDQFMPSTMNSYQRRLIHLHFSTHEDFQDIETTSTGEGTERQMMLTLK